MKERSRPQISLTNSMKMKGFTMEVFKGAAPNACLENEKKKKKEEMEKQGSVGIPNILNKVPLEQDHFLFILTPSLGKAI